MATQTSAANQPDGQQRAEAREQHAQVAQTPLQRSSKAKPASRTGC